MGLIAGKIYDVGKSKTSARAALCIIASQLAMFTDESPVLCLCSDQDREAARLHRSNKVVSWVIKNLPRSREVLNVRDRTILFHLLTCGKYILYLDHTDRVRVIPRGEQEPSVAEELEVLFELVYSGGGSWWQLRQLMDLLPTPEFNTGCWWRQSPQCYRRVLNNSDRVD